MTEARKRWNESRLIAAADRLAGFIHGETIGARPPFLIVPLPTDSAPSTLTELIERTKGRGLLGVRGGTLRCQRTGALLGQVIPVWAGGSDRTVFRTPTANHAFRAWHDSIHLDIGAEFDRAGETAVYEASVARYRARAREVSEDVVDLLRAEILGQLDYLEREGRFPEDQVAVDLAYLNKEETQW